jgi:phage gpG-like protein
MAITIAFAAGADQRVIRYMRTRGPRIIAAAKRRMQQVTIAMQRTVKEEKLSGQVLRNRTGTLRRSINQRVMVEDAIVRGIVGVDVTAPYGKTHEYGFHGRVMVRAHLRKAKETFTVVRAHERNVNLPARPFMRPTLFEYRERILAAMGEAVKEGIRG